jgi:hypothetical protein
MKVLVTAASKYGATGEIAQAIGGVLAERGFEVTVIPPEEVGAIEDYDWRGSRGGCPRATAGLAGRWPPPPGPGRRGRRSSAGCRWRGKGDITVRQLLSTRPACPLSGFRPSEGPSFDHVATEERSIEAHRQRHEHEGGNGENDHLPDGSVRVVLDHLWRCG